MQQAGPTKIVPRARMSEHALSHLVDRVRGIGTKYKLAAIQPLLEACGLLLHQRDLIDIGIFGRFKAGKSSLLNHLAGAPILPVGVTPVTAVVTRIRFGLDQRAVAHYLNGRTAGIPLESIRSFVSESENAENRKGVASVTVELPSLERYHGLQFVDTPGLDSVFQHSTDAALSWLPRVGLALVAISVDPPLSKQDIALIRTLQSYTPRVAIVVTKADLLSDTEIAEVTAFIRERLHQEFGKAFPIVLFSMREGYEELRRAFEADLLFPLVVNHDSERAQIIRFKFDALLSQTREYLSLALAAAERAEADRAELKTQILGEQTSFESIRMDLLALSRESASRTRPWIMKRMDELRPAIIGRVGKELRIRLAELRGNLWKLSRAYELLLMDAVAREMREISQTEGGYFCRPLDVAGDTLSRAVQGFRDRLAGNIRKALGISFDLGGFKSELSKPEIPDISVGRLFDFNADLLWFLIPMPIFRPWFERHFLRMIPYEIEKNLSRLASQWTDRINTAIRNIQEEAERAVRDQIATVEFLLSQARSEAGGIRSALEEIDSQIPVLRS